MTTTSADSGTFDNYGMTATEVTALTVMSGAISYVGTVSNILVILTVLLTRQLRESCTAVLLASLSFCDVLFCALYVPLYIHDINNGSDTVIEAVRWKIGVGVFLASLNAELIVSLDRFVYVCYPYSYINWTSTKDVVIAALCAPYLFALVPILPLLFTRTPIYSFIYIAIIFAVILVLHLSMYRVARRQSQRIDRQYPTSAWSPVHPRMPIWTKSTIAVAITVMASFLCWAPVVILPLIVPVTSPSFKRYSKVILAFPSLGAVTHPFIFCWKLMQFRKALIACMRKLRNQVRVAEMQITRD